MWDAVTIIILRVAYLAGDYLVLNALRKIFNSEVAQVR